MAKVTQTLNPLHFEDLEPHRFEDLSRQLVYDFRVWANLEATGTLGGDEGFDARGRELIYENEDLDEEEIEEPRYKERLWLIQCKREKTIPPARMGKYLDDIFNNTKEETYGIIFIAACNFSKKTRDTFINRIRNYGVKEFQLWGKAELEDLLFQPKNDHLLFAYFGISLQIRKRSIRTLLRSRIATKKRAVRILENSMMRQALLRDSSDTLYPYSGEIPNFHNRPAWKVYNYEGYKHNGLKFLIGKFPAYLDDDQKHYDFLIELNEGRPSNDPWPKPNEKDIDEVAIRKLWSDLPEKNQVHFLVEGVVEYDNVLAIDEDGDNIFKGPHLYIPFEINRGPFSFFYKYIVIYGKNYRKFHADPRNKIEYFPKNRLKKAT